MPLKCNNDLRRRLSSVRRPAWLLVATLCACVTGCGGPKPKVIHGTVTVGGKNVDTGEIRFVPIGDTLGGTNGSKIVDGKYRIEGRRGGLFAGKYRVEVSATKKTGRKVEQDIGGALATVDETVSICPEVYAGRDSPLIEEFTPDSDGRIDIDIPAP